MLMDLFYDEVPVEKKQRVHFHSFMLDVHSSMYLSLSCVIFFSDRISTVPILFMTYPKFRLRGCSKSWQTGVIQQIYNQAKFSSTFSKINIIRVKIKLLLPTLFYSFAVFFKCYWSPCLRSSYWCTDCFSQICKIYLFQTNYLIHVHISSAICRYSQIKS